MVLDKEPEQTPSVVEQIRTLVNEPIGSMNWDRHRLPSERTITNRLGCARMTVRRALWQLEAEGLIYRADRSGWYVSPTRFAYDPSRDVSFTTAAERQGRRPGSVVEQIELGEAGEIVGTALGVAFDAPVVRIVRTRLLENRAVFVERSHVLSSRCPNLAELVKQDVSLARLYERAYSLVIRRLEIVMHPTILAESDARLLRVAPGTPGLHLRRVSADQHGTPFSFDVEAWAHDALLVRIALTSSR